MEWVGEEGTEEQEEEEAEDVEEEAEVNADEEKGVEGVGECREERGGWTTVGSREDEEDEEIDGRTEYELRFVLVEEEEGTTEKKGAIRGRERE